MFQGSRGPPPFAALLLMCPRMYVCRLGPQRWERLCCPRGEPWGRLHTGPVPTAHGTATPGGAGCLRGQQRLRTWERPDKGLRSERLGPRHQISRKSWHSPDDLVGRWEGWPTTPQLGPADGVGHGLEDCGSGLWCRAGGAQVLRVPPNGFEMCSQIPDQDAELPLMPAHCSSRKVGTAAPVHAQ